MLPGRTASFPGNDEKHMFQQSDSSSLAMTA